VVLITTNLKNRNLKFLSVENFLTNLKQEFGNRDNKSVKVLKLKKVEQETKTTEKFVQEFKRVFKKYF